MSTSRLDLILKYNEILKIDYLNIDKFEYKYMYNVYSDVSLIEECIQDSYYYLNSNKNTDYKFRSRIQSMNHTNKECANFFTWYRSKYLTIQGNFKDDYYHIKSRQIHDELIYIFWKFLNHTKYYKELNTPDRLFTLTMRYAIDQKLSNQKNIIYRKNNRIYREFKKQIKYNKKYIKESYNTYNYIAYITKLQNDTKILISKKLEHYSICAREDWSESFYDS